MLRWNKPSQSKSKINWPEEVQSSANSLEPGETARNGLHPRTSLPSPSVQVAPVLTSPFQFGKATAPVGSAQRARGSAPPNESGEAGEAVILGVTYLGYDHG